MIYKARAHLQETHTHTHTRETRAKTTEGEITQIGRDD